MSSYGTYDESTGLWTFTCNECGAEFTADSQEKNPLDGLGCCSADCDIAYEAKNPGAGDPPPEYDELT